MNLHKFPPSFLLFEGENGLLGISLHESVFTGNCPPFFFGNLVAKLIK